MDLKNGRMLMKGRKRKTVDRNSLNLRLWKKKNKTTEYMYIFCVRLFQDGLRMHFKLITHIGNECRKGASWNGSKNAQDQ